MADQTLPPPPQSSQLALKDHTVAPIWARWFQQLCDAVTAAAKAASDAAAAAAGGGLAYAYFNTHAGQSIPSGTTTVINYDTLLVDTDGAVTTGAAWKWTCPVGKDGLHQVSATGTANSSSAGDYILLLLKNGVEVHRFQRAEGNGGLLGLTGTLVISLVAGDYVQVGMFQNSGLPGTLEATAIANAITITALRA